MRLRVVLVLFCIAALLGIALWQLYQHKPSPQEQTLVIPVTISDIESITLVRKGRTLVAHYSPQKGWQVSAPHQRPGNTFLDYLASDLSNLRKLATIHTDGTTAELAKYGLDKPKVTIQLLTTRGSYTLLVGDVCPAAKGVYVKLENSPEVYAVERQILIDSNHPPEHFMDIRVFYQVRGWEITAVKIIRTDATISLQQQEQEQDWHLREPVKDIAADNVVGKIQLSLGNLIWHRLVATGSDTQRYIPQPAPLQVEFEARSRDFKATVLFSHTDLEKKQFT
jgi:hypothetical protein